MLIDDVLYRRGFDGFMLRSVGEVEADNLMWQVSRWRVWFTPSRPQDALVDSKTRKCITNNYL